MIKKIKDREWFLGSCFFCSLKYSEMEHNFRRSEKHTDYCMKFIRKIATSHDSAWLSFDVNVFKNKKRFRKQATCQQSQTLREKYAPP